MLTLQKLKELKQGHRGNLIIYKLLSTIIGECEQISKNPSNNDIVGVLQKLYKDNEATLKECPQDRKELIANLQEENNFIEMYLPKKLTESELTAIIGSQLASENTLPMIMKYLSTNYKGQYDGKVAISIINSLNHE